MTTIPPSFSQSNNLTVAIRIFATCIGLSIIGYLNPLHSPIGHDFLPNAISFMVIALGLTLLLFKNPVEFNVKHYSLSNITWLFLALLLCIQPLLSNIKYPDALIFPVLCLLLVMIASLVTTNLLSTSASKRQFINQVSMWLYITLLLTFIIQIMQSMNYAITLGGWGITRGSALPDRLDGNFGQVNHTAYAYIFGICCAMYQLDTLKQRRYQAVLMALLAIFAVGISLTKSRAVIIMLCVATLVYFFSQKGHLKKQIAWCTGILSIFAISYLLGGVVMSALSPDKVDATGGVGRIVSSGMDSQRMALTRRAIMIFQDYPITGIGWRNYAIGGIPHVDEMQYVTFSDNSHMIFTQIASELGILGLLCLMPVILVLIRSIHTRHSAESAMALAFVIATIIYACFEYPLWYFRYLAVFAIFLAMIDQKNRTFSTVQMKLSRLLGTVTLVLSLGSVYYCYQYWTHKYLFWYSHPELGSQNGDIDLLKKHRGVFGFLNYSDMDLASVVEISPDMLPEKLALFDRVLVDESSGYNLVAYGRLLTFNGEQAKALTMFKTACRMTDSKAVCGDIADTLKSSAQQYPQQFQTTYNAYQTWLNTRKLY